VRCACLAVCRVANAVGQGRPGRLTGLRSDRGEGRTGSSSAASSALARCCASATRVSRLPGWRDPRSPGRAGSDVWLRRERRDTSTTLRLPGSAFGGSTTRRSPASQRIGPIERPASPRCRPRRHARPDAPCDPRARSACAGQVRLGRRPAQVADRVGCGRGCRYVVSRRALREVARACRSSAAAWSSDRVMHSSRTALWRVQRRPPRLRKAPQRRGPAPRSAPSAERPTRLSQLRPLGVETPRRTTVPGETRRRDRSSSISPRRKRPCVVAGPGAPPSRADRAFANRAIDSHSRVSCRACALSAAYATATNSWPQPPRSLRRGELLGPPSSDGA